jgi:hypothetical protein
MEFITSHFFEASSGPVKVPAHWKFGQAVEGRIIVNKHFYGITPEQFGKKINAEVIFRFKEREGQKYLFVDIHHQPGKVSMREMKFIEDGEIAIPGSKTGISVVERS